MNATIVVVLLSGSLLLIIGGLFGYSLSERLLRSDLRERTELGRRISEQWRAIRAERSRQEEACCPRCGWSSAAERVDRVGAGA